MKKAIPVILLAVFILGLSYAGAAVYENYVLPYKERTAPPAAKDIADQPYSELETALFKQARKSTFMVVARDSEGEVAWTGTAFLASIGGKEVIVTAGHVCKLGDYTFVLHQEDDMFPTRVIAISSTSDTCFMTASQRLFGVKPYTIKRKPLPYGKLVAAVGHAFGGRLTQYVARLIGAVTVEMDGQLYTYVAAKGAVYPGQSGGPVVDNLDGTAIALVSATDYQNAYFTSGAVITSEFNTLVLFKGLSTREP